jgi:hypothetical protein
MASFSSEEPAQDSERERSMDLDFFSPFEIGLERLLEQMNLDHTLYFDFMACQARLAENIRCSRRFGDTSDRQAERTEIIEQLNRLTLSTLGISFDDLCSSE